MLAQILVWGKTGQNEVSRGFALGLYARAKSLQKTLIRTLFLKKPCKGHIYSKYGRI